MTSTSEREWRRIVASSLDWEQAHLTLEKSVQGLTPEQRGERPSGVPHSVWELLEHIRLTQHDLLEFCTNPDYEETLKWPDDYWPRSPAPTSDAEWRDCLAAITRDRDALKAFTMDETRDLTTKIPRGTGQTYLRTVLVAMDHASHHVGQIVIVRRAFGAWSEER
jgi:uncharacterized damage-inducible protein DinB